MKNLFSFIYMIFLWIIFIFHLYSQQTPDYSSYQGYLDSAPLGIGARDVWHISGAKGYGVTIVDVEKGWNLDHEDLPENITRIHGDNWVPSIDHGTAVLGEMVGVENGFGITGICPAASIKVSSYIIEGSDQNLESAIDAAINSTNYGDIILLEVEIPDETHLKKVYPAEKDPAARAKIIDAITAGRVVIEAAGNSQYELNTSTMGSSKTGAIIVAGGSSTAMVKNKESNYGDFVDMHA